MCSRTCERKTKREREISIKSKKSTLYLRISLARRAIKGIHNLPCGERRDVDEHKHADHHEQFIVLDKLCDEEDEEEEKVEGNINKTLERQEK